MTNSRSATRSIPVIVALLAGGLSNAGGESDLLPYREESVIEIITIDPDAESRETKIWCVVLDDGVYIRTNDSRWLENIRRDPRVVLRARGEERPFVVTVRDDDETYDRVEEAFKQKYGTMQRIMSALRFSRPTVMFLSEAPAEEAR